MTCLVNNATAYNNSRSLLSLDCPSAALTIPLALPYFLNEILTMLRRGDGSEGGWEDNHKIISLVGKSVCKPGCVVGANDESQEIFDPLTPCPKWPGTRGTSYLGAQSG